jgi:hypothetical protein
MRAVLQPSGKWRIRCRACCLATWPVDGRDRSAPAGTRQAKSPTAKMNCSPRATRSGPTNSWPTRFRSSPLASRLLDCADTRGPNPHCGRHAFTAREHIASYAGGDDLHSRHVHAERAQVRRRCGGNRLRECAEDAGRGFKQGRAQPPAEIRLGTATASKIFQASTCPLKLTSRSTLRLMRILRSQL